MLLRTSQWQDATIVAHKVLLHHHPIHFTDSHWFFPGMAIKSMANAPFRILQFRSEERQFVFADIWLSRLCTFLSTECHSSRMVGPASRCISDEVWPPSPPQFQSWSWGTSFSWTLWVIRNCWWMSRAIYRSSLTELSATPSR